MRTKRPFRWDKVIGYVTLLVIVIFGLVVYNDLKGGKTDKVNANETEQQASLAGAGNTKSDKAIVCIDAGHGGTDAGAISKNKYEKDQTLQVALDVQKDLEASGIKVVMTRTTDKSLELSDRTQIANDAGAVAFVSIHRNYYEKDSTTRGVEAWIHSSKPADSKKLATDIMTQLKSVKGVSDRGVKTGTMADTSKNYYINSHSSCASCIIELGFMSNTSDTELVTTNRSKSAKAIADGIKNYLDRMGYKYG